MSATLNNGTIVFGNGSTQSVSQLSNYNYMSQQWTMGNYGSQVYTMSVTAGPQGLIHLIIDAPWTETADTGLGSHTFTVYSSPDNSSWSQFWQSTQYANGYSGRYSAGNFSLTYPIGVSAYQTYYFQFARTTGSASPTSNWLTVMGFGV